MTDPCTKEESFKMMQDSNGRQWNAIESLMERIEALAQGQALMNQRIEVHLAEERLRLQMAQTVQEAQDAARKSSWAARLEGVFWKAVELGMIGLAGYLLLHWAGKA